MVKSYRELQKIIRERIEENRRMRQAVSGLRCPHCGSTNVEDYPEEDRMEGLAMYWATGFPQATMRMRYSYRCNDCGYEW